MQKGDSGQSWAENQDQFNQIRNAIVLVSAPKESNQEEQDTISNCSLVYAPRDFKYLCKSFLTEPKSITPVNALVALNKGIDAFLAMITDPAGTVNSEGIAEKDCSSSTHVTHPLLV
ncbi:hypothetical protein R3P38DRAFT_2758778 [Favolaschia claudopus]|uniref:Uncharacterized protein n=1 Tax=Favolaschia claudopus TaxID=2862362 RepID=A0AAW0E7A3_9AGAR